MIRGGAESECRIMPRLVRFSDLSAPRKALVRLCQSMNYGSIEGLEVRDSDPIFSPPPLVLIDIRLDNDEGPRTQVGLSDFVLRDEARRLMERFETLKNATIERVEVRAGIPRRVVFKLRATDALRWPAPSPDADAVQSLLEIL